MDFDFEGIQELFKQMICKIKKKEITYKLEIVIRTIINLIISDSKDKERVKYWTSSDTSFKIRKFSGIRKPSHSFQNSILKLALMSTKRNTQKITQLTTDLLSGPSIQSPKKLISKYYDLASTINQDMPTQTSDMPLSAKERQTKQRLTILLKQLKESFEKFKESKENEIKQLNQVEYYMFEETERILLKYEPTLVDIVVEKINSIKRIFINPEKKSQKDSGEGSQTSSSLSDKEQKSGSKPQSLAAILPMLNSHRSLPKQHMQITPKTFPNSWQRIIFYYQNHRIDEAYNQMIKFENYREINLVTTPLTVQQEKLIETIKLEYKTMNSFFERFNDTGYTFDKEEKGISLWYKIVGGKDVAIKVEAQIDITIENFLCIASEIDLFEDYIPFSYGTKELKQISRNQKIGTSKVYIPLLTDRQTYFYAAAYDRLQTKGSIFFFSKTINQDLEYQQRYGFRVPEQSDLVRLEYKHYILEYKPITKNRGKIRMVSSIDLKMQYLPMFIINKTARVFSFDYMKNYQTINKKFQGSKWDKIKQEKKEMYDYFKTKIDEYLVEKDQFGA